MGNYMSSFFGRMMELWSGGEVKVLLVGLDAAGKTTIMYKLVVDETFTTTPTLGSQVEQLTYKNTNFLMWDMGGQESCRSSWEVYYPNTKAVIFVVDSSDRERIAECRKELATLLKHPELKDAVVLVYANKQDLATAMPPSEISEALALSSIRDHSWHIQRSCGLTGEGLFEGLEWLVARLEEGARS
mmetsp:Transcript_22031/g.61950  ORF Transcript_22031/g.61950 Transcript_22031/m.61950 type:complete len:187 (+) Transcript_22031:71-631(+)